MRNAFIQELVELARTNPRIALIVGDLGYSVVEPFADEFPDRFINAGVAEQNMTGLAAGMASEGYHIFTYSIANFPTYRCAEQIRNDVAYHQLPVTVVSVGGGLAYGALGYSHHAVQDYALIRSFPNMLIAAPGDPMEVRACMRYLSDNPQPSYLRLGKAGEPCFHPSVPDIAPGRWLKVAPPRLISATQNRLEHNTLICTGAALATALNWQNATHFETYSVHSMPLWGLDTKHLQASQLSHYQRVQTLEDHLSDGGFGSWMLEAANGTENMDTSIKISALSAAVCGTVGSQSTLNSLGGLPLNWAAS